MAASYWKSSQFDQWLFDRQELMSVRLRDISSWSSNNNSSLITEDDYSKILIFLTIGTFKAFSNSGIKSFKSSYLLLETLSRNMGTTA